MFNIIKCTFMLADMSEWLDLNSEYQALDLAVKNPSNQAGLSSPSFGFLICFFILKHCL